MRLAEHRPVVARPGRFGTLERFAIAYRRGRPCNRGRRRTGRLGGICWQENSSQGIGQQRRRGEISLVNIRHIRRCGDA